MLVGIWDVHWGGYGLLTNLPGLKSSHGMGEARGRGVPLKHDKDSPDCVQPAQAFSGDDVSPWPQSSVSTTLTYPISPLRVAVWGYLFRGSGSIIGSKRRNPTWKGSTNLGCVCVCLDVSERGGS